MTQVPSTPHRYFQLLVKIQQENGLQLVEAHKNNKAGKFKSFKIIYPKLLLFSGWTYMYMYILEAATGGVLYKKVFLKFAQCSQKNTCVGASQLYKKETPIKVFSWEYCKIFKNNDFEEHL